MPTGYMGKILMVNLSDGTFEEQEIPDSVYEKFLSGAGLGGFILYNNIPADADPLFDSNQQNNWVIEKISEKEIAGYDKEEYTHMAVAANVLTGIADCGLGILAAAEALNLDFIPCALERYDLFIPQKFFNTKSLEIKNPLSLISSTNL